MKAEPFGEARVASDFFTGKPCTYLFPSSERKRGQEAKEVAEPETHDELRRTKDEA